MSSPSPKRVVEVGVERFILAVAAEEGYDVLPRVSAAASKSKYGCELFGQDEREREIREMI